MKNIVVTGNCGRKSVAEAADRLLPFIEKHGRITATDWDMTLDLEKSDGDVLVVLGGDGSILGAARRMGRRQMPVLGVNFGKLGFLALFSEQEFRAEFPDIVKGKANISRRQMLYCYHIRDGATIHETPAANEIVVSQTTPRIIDVRLYMDELPLTTYSGDGVIVATATGSTGYSLSAGGPILEPELDCFLVAPICAHTLTSRPVVYSAGDVVKLELLTESREVTLTVDGQVNFEMKPHDLVIAERFDHSFQLVQPMKTKFFDTLRDKLNWGGQANYASHSDC